MPCEDREADRRAASRSQACRPARKPGRLTRLPGPAASTGSWASVPPGSKGKSVFLSRPSGASLWHWGTELTLPHTAVNRDGEERVPERTLAGCPKGDCYHYRNDGRCRQGAGPTPFT